MTTFGENVRKRRLELGMTLQEVADRMGVTRQYVSRVEQGKYGRPRENTAVRFAVALDARIRYGETNDVGFRAISQKGLTSPGRSVS